MSGWLVFAVVACVVLCTGCVLAVALLRAVWAQREREALTSSDLRALEESAVLLIEQLKAEVNEGVEQLDAKCSELRSLIQDADARLSEIPNAPGRSNGARTTRVSSSACAVPSVRKQKILKLASRGVTPSEIARKEGVGCAEVELVLRLAKLSAN